MIRKYLLFVLTGIFVLVCISCTSKSNPVMPTLENYEIDSNFIIRCILAEPLIEAPVQIEWDLHGNLWVLEMRDYMPNLNGEFEDASTGRIQICRDSNEDGILDACRVVLDSLHNARAFCLAYGGILYAEPPYLRFAKLENNNLEAESVVDSFYALGGNIEHQANALLKNIDNWIYSAKSNARYRFYNGQWQKEASTLRGQWGLSHDIYGRLYYNHNSVILQADCSIPNAMVGNPFLYLQTASAEDITNDTRIYPAHATAINRGYMEGHLDERGRVISVTSACAPLVTNLSKDNCDVLVCVPEANLIKRITLQLDKPCPEANYYYSDSTEFLRSTDEGFRPVNLSEGPDGNVYIVDMHRGIIQHKTYMTSYLRSLIREKSLDTIRGMGRILMISKRASADKYTPIEPEIPTDKLVNLLFSSYKQLRNQAQWLLVAQMDTSTPSLIRKKLGQKNNELADLHMTYVLEALGDLKPDDLSILLTSEDPWIVSNGLSLAAGLDIDNFPDQLFSNLAARNSEVIDIHLAAYFSNRLCRLFQHSEIQDLFSKNRQNLRFLEAIFTRLDTSNLHLLRSVYRKDDLAFKVFAEIESNRKTSRFNPQYDLSARTSTDSNTRGRNLYNTHCAICHGMGGDGVAGLGPSLLEGRISSFGAEAIALSVLNGLKDPVTIGDKKLKYNSIMPALAGNVDFTDQEIRDLVNYVSNAFSPMPNSIDEEVFKRLKSRIQPPRELTEEEILAILHLQ